MKSISTLFLVVAKVTGNTERQVWEAEVGLRLSTRTTRDF